MSNETNDDLTRATDAITGPTHAAPITRTRSDILHDWEWQCEELCLTLRFDVLFLYTPQTPNTADTPGEGVAIDRWNSELKLVDTVPTEGGKVFSQLPEDFRRFLTKEVWGLWYFDNLEELDDAIREQIESGVAA